jgi:hypothetical protein
MSPSYVFVTLTDNAHAADVRARRFNPRNADYTDMWNFFALPYAVTRDLQTRRRPCGVGVGSNLNNLVRR